MSKDLKRFPELSHSKISLSLVMPLKIISMSVHGVDGVDILKNDGRRRSAPYFWYRRI